MQGLLIYVSPASRAGIAILVCAVSVANLNYFQPYKSRVLFWLDQLSFITILAKYTIALLLSSASSAGASAADKFKEQQFIGVLLIVFDVGFMVSSVLALLVSFWFLQAKFKKINDQSRQEVRTRIVPMAAPNIMPPRVVNVQELREIRLQYGAGSEEYAIAAQGINQKEVVAPLFPQPPPPKKLGLSKNRLSVSKGKGVGGVSVITTVALILGMMAMCVQSASMESSIDTDTVAAAAVPAVPAATATTTTVEYAGHNNTPIVILDNVLPDQAFDLVEWNAVSSAEMNGNPMRNKRGI